jgi:hypothetical protein
MTMWGCESPLNSTFEYKTLPVNKDGHFKEDITYKYDDDGSYYITQTYKSDGTFISSNFEYEGTGSDLDGDGNQNEGWVQTSGLKGTYNYDDKNYKITLNYTQIYGDDPSTAADTTYVWYNIITDPSNPNYNPLINKSYYTNSIYFEHDSYTLYTGSDNIFSCETLRTYVDNKSKYYYYTYDFATSGKISYTYIYQQKDANGTVTSGTKEVYTFNISETFPAGVKFENGKTVSFYYDFCNVKVYSWDVVNNNWKTTPNSDNSYNEYGLFLTIVKSSDGKAIYFINEQFYRSMINESLLSR